jgi:hypothetical protein
MILDVERLKLGQISEDISSIIPKHRIGRVGIGTPWIVIGVLAGRHCSRQHEKDQLYHLGVVSYVFFELFCKGTTKLAEL